ncbi:MAG TPA: VTT domain-containing protein [Terriglobales bacterium]|nr:VTT domain-containing protein [Terriglobales bacterium]
MNTVKHIISRYTSFLWGILGPLGMWGVFLAAVLDGGAFGLPIDIVVAGYVSQNHRRWIAYALMAAIGSAIGSLVIYAIGYAGGEELLRKRVTPERFKKLHNAFDQHPFWSLMFPAMLPPPTPFKMFALAAGVAEMGITHFILAIFFGRVLRFSALALLVMQFGPGEVHKLRIFFSHHFHWILLTITVLILFWWIVRRMLTRRTARTHPASPVTK